MAAYYNEIEPFPAQWLRNLIAAGHIAPGDVDERSIVDVHPTDLAGYRQCHFFAGIGIWSYALRLAGVPDDAEVWTGSCPCQPFSDAGQGKGFADERHLWPAFYGLIAARRPFRILGEQVASRDGLAWLDHVLVDLEGADYSTGAVDTCSAGFGAPHIRQRLYWVAYAGRAGLERRAAGALGNERQAAERSRSFGWVVDADGDGWSPGLAPAEAARYGLPAVADGGVCGLADTHGIPGRQGSPIARRGDPGSDAQPRPGSGSGRGDCWPGPTNGFWRAADWLGCRDGKWRPVEPGTFPLVDGAAARVGRLRAYGNAINAEQAAAFIRCCP